MNRIIAKRIIQSLPLKNTRIIPQIKLQIRREYHCEGKVYGYNALAWKNKKESLKSKFFIERESYKIIKMKFSQKYHKDTFLNF
jgi:hypothetical protein